MSKADIRATNINTGPAANVRGIYIRALQSGEERPILDIFAGLSAESRRMRFLTATPRLPAPMLKALATVDHVNHAAYLAVLDKTPIGIGRWVRQYSRTDEAEVALAVTDAQQGRGVGPLLLKELARSAAVVGVRTFTYVHDPDNARVARLAKRFGGSSAHIDGLIERRTPLPLVQMPDPAYVSDISWA